MAANAFAQRGTKGGLFEKEWFRHIEQRQDVLRRTESLWSDRSRPPRKPKALPPAKAWAPGDARRLVAGDGLGMYDVGAAAASSNDIDAALAARPTDLQLLSNNCWSHTIDAAAAALGTDRGGAVRALVGAVLRRRPWRPVARPPVARDSVAEALAAEKSKRYGTSLAGLFSEEDRARAGASIKAALADEAEPPG